MSRIVAALLALVAVFVASGAHAQPYPSRPIKILVPFTAGGSSDMVARAIGAKLPDSLPGATIVVENRPGANGSIAADLLAKSPADGYTLLVGSIGTFAINVALNPKLTYHPLRDFDLVTVAVRNPNILIATPKFPANTLAELVAHMKKNPGRTSMVSSGTGSSDHLSAELLWQRTGTTGIHVPYKGGSAAMTDLIGGAVDASFQNLGAASGHIKGGRLKALAVTSDKRSPVFPDVPTMAEAGVSGFEVYSWQAVAAPKGLPKDVYAKINAAVIAALQAPDTKARFDAQGFDVVANTPEQFGEFLKGEIARWTQVVNTAGIKPD
ncbi:MAG: tripartite tricarboxylate transporter substrate binding protein [Betaproteobacteria bacterium]|nr:tripartite tricarboxylate transporter substrate binding protein [Betaproteobacteria bacterium]